MGHLLQFFGGALRRKGKDNPLLGKKLPYLPEGRHKVTVGGYQQGRVESVLKRVRQQFYRDIHVRHLLVRHSIRMAAIEALTGIELVFAEEDRDAGQRSKGFDESCLSFLFVRRLRNSGSEVLN